MTSLQLGFKVDIFSCIYKLPGKITSFLQLVNQIRGSLGNRIPTYFRISYLNEERERILLCCDSDFSSLTRFATKRNLKNIKLQVHPVEDEQTTLQSSLLSWVSLLDKLDSDDSLSSPFCLFDEDEQFLNISIFETSKHSLKLELTTEEKVPFNTCDSMISTTTHAPTFTDNILAIGEQITVNLLPATSESCFVLIDESTIIFIRSQSTQSGLHYEDQSTIFKATDFISTLTGVQ